MRDLAAVGVLPCHRLTAGRRSNFASLALYSSHHGETFQYRTKSSPIACPGGGQAMARRPAKLALIPCRLHHSDVRSGLIPLKKSLYIALVLWLSD